MARVKILVPISGGKDSQACLKLALKHHPASDIRGLFCDTQFEHPETYKHVELLKTLYGVEIVTVTGGSVLEKSLKYGRFPGGGARHCTDELKIRETRIYCKALAEQQGSRRLRGLTSDYDEKHQADGGFEVWYGMRTGESNERAERYAGKVSADLYAPHEVMSKYPKYLAKMGVMFRLAVVDWSELDVLEFLEGDEHPFYAEGFPRVGCFPCLASGDKWKEKAFRRDDFGRSQLAKVMVVSAQIGKSIWTSKGGKARNEFAPPCAACVD